jgi:hypothetical protein
MGQAVVHVDSQMLFSNAPQHPQELAYFLVLFLFFWQYSLLSSCLEKPQYTPKKFLRVAACQVEQHVMPPHYTPDPPFCLSVVHLLDPQVDRL